MSAAAPRSYLEALLARVGLQQAEFGRRIGQPKQAIQKWINGKPIAYEAAKAMAPHLGIEWWTLMEGQALDKRTADIEEGIGVRQVMPNGGKIVDDPDELALLVLWDGLSITKKAALFAYLGADDMPSLRRKA